jgi:CheY-like chemotaxis protein
MTDELVSLRAILLSAAPNDHDMFRQAASTARVPIEIVACKSVAVACQALAEGEAAEGAAAVKLAGEREFDIVFLDYNMPGFNGLETLAEFKREKRRMTIVVMSSAQDATLAERVRLQGAAFLRKPFFPADIEAVLTRHYGLTALNPKRG